VGALRVNPEDRSRRGRGAVSSPGPRYLADQRVAFDDGWHPDDPPLAPVPTTVTPERSRSILTRNESPDLPFDRTVNPYRGCEHGCVYCYARPAHAWMDLSPGLDFERRLFAKPDAARLLREAFDAPTYRPAVLALGANTDPWQPVEREHGITRRVLEVLAEYRHPVSIVTKSALIERDIDILGDMAADGLAEVHVSVTSLSRELSRRMEPRAAAPQRRLLTIERLRTAGIPTGVMFAPVIPAINEEELESVLEAAASAGAQRAGFVLLRLPLEVRPLFIEWLETHYPERRDRVLGHLRERRAGALNSSVFGERQRGIGLFAQLLQRRFELCCRRLGLMKELPALDCTRFRRPAGGQLSLL
jgi:DNA repair photolyase